MSLDCLCKSSTGLCMEISHTQFESSFLKWFSKLTYLATTLHHFSVHIFYFSKIHCTFLMVVLTAMFSCQGGGVSAWVALRPAWGTGSRGGVLGPCLLPGPFFTAALLCSACRHELAALLHCTLAPRCLCQKPSTMDCTPETWIQSKPLFQIVIGAVSGDRDIDSYSSLPRVSSMWIKVAYKSSVKFCDDMLLPRDNRFFHVWDPYLLYLHHNFWRAHFILHFIMQYNIALEYFPCNSQDLAQCLAYRR